MGYGENGDFEGDDDGEEEYNLAQAAFIAGLNTEQR